MTPHEKKKPLPSIYVDGYKRPEETQNEGCLPTFFKATTLSLCCLMMAMIAYGVIYGRCGYVVDKKQGKVYIDKNNDKSADYVIDFSKDTINPVYQYIMPGDKFSYIRQKRTSESEIPVSDIRDIIVNNRCAKDIEQIMSQNKVRAALGLPKQR